MKKFIFVDFDNTLFSHKTKEIPQSAIQALNSLDKNKYQLVLCTGRSKYELDYYFDLPYIPYDYYIYNNGSLISDKDNNYIYDSPFDGISKDEVINLYQQKEYPVSLSTYDANFINKITPEVKKVFTSEKHYITVKDYNNEKFYLASIYLKEAMTKEFYNQYLSHCIVTEFNKYAYDIVTSNNSKDIAIKTLINYLNADIKDTISFGDSENDIGMLKLCNLSIAMGNGIEKVKEAAKYVTSDIDDNGLYNALKHFNII